MCGQGWSSSREDGATFLGRIASAWDQWVSNELCARASLPLPNILSFLCLLESYSSLRIHLRCSFIQEARLIFLSGLPALCDRETTLICEGTVATHEVENRELLFFFGGVNMVRV